MREKDFQTRFNRWLKYSNFGSGAFELKLTKKKSIPFSAVKEHQINALWQVKNKKFIYKISDEDRRQKPFDCFMLNCADAFVVIMFYRRGQKTFYMIDIADFLIEKKTSTRRSLTEKRCSEIGTSYELGKIYK